MPAVVAVLSSGGVTSGMNYYWRPDPVPVVDLVTEYRIDQCEARGASLVRQLASLEARMDELPPDFWEEKINTIEREVKEISRSLIRLELHGHPELKYDPERK